MPTFPTQLWFTVCNCWFLVGYTLVMHGFIIMNGIHTHTNINSSMEMTTLLPTLHHPWSSFSTSVITSPGVSLSSCLSWGLYWCNTFAWNAFFEFGSKPSVGSESAAVWWMWLSNCNERWRDKGARSCHKNSGMASWTKTFRGKLLFTTD